MWFTNEVSSPREHLNVYIKWLGDKPVNPQFEVNHKDWTKTYHKKIEDAKFISLQSNIYTTDAYWEKKQAKILFEFDWETYSLSGNFTAPMKSIVNTMIGAIQEWPLDTFSIVLDVKDLWTKKIGQAKVIVNWKIPKRGFTWDDVKDMAELYKLSDEDMWYKIVDDFAKWEKPVERDLEKELDEEAAKAHIDAWAKLSKKAEDTDSLPF